jgi:hypothetical protein
MGVTPIAIATPVTPIITPTTLFHVAGSPDKKRPETITPMNAVLALTIEAIPPVTYNWPKAIKLKGKKLLRTPIIITEVQKHN